MAFAPLVEPLLVPALEAVEGLVVGEVESLVEGQVARRAGQAAGSIASGVAGKLASTGVKHISNKIQQAAKGQIKTEETQPSQKKPRMDTDPAKVPFPDDDLPYDTSGGQPVDEPMAQEPQTTSASGGGSGGGAGMMAPSMGRYLSPYSEGQQESIMTLTFRQIQRVKIPTLPSPSIISTNDRPSGLQFNPDPPHTYYIMDWCMLPNVHLNYYLDPQDFATRVPSSYTSARILKAKISSFGIYFQTTLPLDSAANTTAITEPYLYVYEDVFKHVDNHRNTAVGTNEDIVNFSANIPKIAYTETARPGESVELEACRKWFNGTGINTRNANTTSQSVFDPYNIQSIMQDPLLWGHVATMTARSQFNWTWTNPAPVWIYPVQNGRIFQDLIPLNAGYGRNQIRTGNRIDSTSYTKPCDENIPPHVPSILLRPMKVSVADVNAEVTAYMDLIYEATIQVKCHPQLWYRAQALTGGNTQILPRYIALNEAGQFAKGNEAYLGHNADVRARIYDVSSYHTAL